MVGFIKKALAAGDTDQELRLCGHLMTTKKYLQTNPKRLNRSYYPSSCPFATLMSQKPQQEIGNRSLHHKTTINRSIKTKANN